MRFVVRVELHRQRQALGREPRAGHQAARISGLERRVGLQFPQPAQRTDRRARSPVVRLGHTGDRGYDLRTPQIHSACEMVVLRKMERLTILTDFRNGRLDFISQMDMPWQLRS